MKLVGMVMIFVSALAFSYNRNVGISKRERVLTELFRLIEHIKLEIGCYLRPIREIAENFESNELSDNGFLSDMVTKGPHKAYRILSERIFLGEGAHRVLERFFSTLGMGYANDEMRLIDTTLKELGEMLRLEAENAPKAKKLSLTLSFSGALALIILLV